MGSCGAGGYPQGPRALPQRQRLEAVGQLGPQAPAVDGGGSPTCAGPSQARPERCGPPSGRGDRSEPCDARRYPSPWIPASLPSTGMASLFGSCASATLYVFSGRVVPLPPLADASLIHVVWYSGGGGGGWFRHFQSCTIHMYWICIHVCSGLYGRSCVCVLDLGRSMVYCMTWSLCRHVFGVAFRKCVWKKKRKCVRAVRCKLPEFDVRRHIAICDLANALH